MRYIPMSQYTFEEICQQCYNAINTPTVIREALKYDEHLYNEIRKADEWCKELTDVQNFYSMKDYGSLIKAQ